MFFLQNKKLEVILLVTLLFSRITTGALLPSKTLTLQEIHLVRCVTYISHRYFAPGRTLVISSPATYRDVQQELIAEIHRTSFWPVVVTVDGNISKTDKTDFIDRDGIYIILTPDGNIKSLKAEFTGLDRDRTKRARLWNSEARFVVAAGNGFSMPQQRDIFNFFSKFIMYNCIIVSREYRIKNEEYSRRMIENDADTGMKLGVYTWFPYQSSDRCTEVDDITQLDRWVISAQGHFTKNTDLFPRKISKSLNGCAMKAVVRDCEWYFTTQYIRQQDSNGRVAIYVIGLEKDLLLLVLKQINMTFIHIPTPKGLKFGME